MNNNEFKEQLRKYRVLDSDSYKNSVCYIKKFKGVKSFSIISDKLSYIELCIKLKGVTQTIQFVLDGLKVFNADTDGDYKISLKLINNTPLIVEGCCSDMLLLLQGAKFDFVANDSILPLNNLLVKNSGDYMLYSYQTLDDLINNNFSIHKTFDEYLSLQTYLYQEQPYIGMLYNNSGLYFCTSMDNYTEKLCVTSGDVVSATTIQDYDNNILYFVYIKENGVFYKILNSDSDSLSDEIELNKNINKIPFCIVGAQTYIKGTKFFAIYYRDGSFDLCCLNSNTSIQNVAKFSAKNIKIIEKENCIVLFVYDDYQVTILKYLVDLNKVGGNILELHNSEIINNVVCCDELDDYLITISIGLVSEQRGLLE